MQWDLTYDFYMDSNGHISAFKPSERVVPNYALILESGYDPGVYATDASGKITVVLSDGTTDTFALNFSASAKNLADQIEAYNDENNVAGGIAEYSTTDRVKELKGFLGTDYTDTSNSKPWGDGAVDGSANNPANHGKFLFAEKNLDGTGTGSSAVTTDDYKHSVAAGYVITYTLDEDNKLTIQSVVGNATATTNAALTGANAKPGYNLGAYHVDSVDPDYDKGDAQLNHVSANPSSQKYMAVDLNTIAFYFWVDDDGENCGSVVTGYKNMVDIKTGDAAKDKNFVATASGSRYNDGAYVSSRTNLAEMVLFNHKGPESSKSFVYILGRNNHYDSGKYVDLFGVDKDGKALTLKVKRSDWETDFDGQDDAYKKVWQYSTNAEGVTSLTAIQENTISGHQVILGSVLRLTSGTVAFTAEGTCGAGNYHNIDNYLSKTTYDKSFALETETGHVWNVRNLETGSDASQGNISTNSPKHAIIILNEKDGNKIETAYVWDYTADEKTEPSGVTLTSAGNATTVAANGTLVLTAAATGFTSPTYQWKVNGTNVGTNSSTFTLNGADYSVGNTLNVVVEVSDRYHTGTASMTITVGAAASTPKINIDGIDVYNADGTKVDPIDNFGKKAVDAPAAGGSLLIQKAAAPKWAAGEHYAYNGKVYAVGQNGCIEIPAADLEGVTDIAAGNFTQVYALHLPTGVTVASVTAGELVQDTAGNYYYAANAAAVKPTFTTGTYVLLTSGTAKSAKAAAKLTSGTALTLTTGDVWVKEANTLTATGLTTNIGGNFASGDYVVVGTPVTVTGVATTATQAQKLTVTGVAAADVTAANSTDPDGDGTFDTAATATFNMPAAAVTVTEGNA